jgi:hypothetical protein
VIGAILGAAVLYAIASGTAGFSLNGGFAANGYADHSLGHYSLVAGFISEVTMTFGLLFVILGSTHGRAAPGRSASPATVRPQHPIRPRRLTQRECARLNSAPAGRVRREERVRLKIEDI